MSNLLANLMFPARNKNVLVFDGLPSRPSVHCNEAVATDSVPCASFTSRHIKPMATGAAWHCSQRYTIHLHYHGQMLQSRIAAGAEPACLRGRAPENSAANGSSLFNIDDNVHLGLLLHPFTKR
ncbi:hypothetical protein BaRGS_00015482 [Batillaria attramentaria]|uniref:Uncharacterized protein n=1 Tax=Batillaria attramentaria TaxID=370345 RepID=A0ABD0L289_9CAEN